MLDMVSVNQRKKESQKKSSSRNEEDEAAPGRKTGEAGDTPYLLAPKRLRFLRDGNTQTCVEQYALSVCVAL